MTTLLIILGLLLALAGVFGCIFPVIPGPPLGYLALIILSWAKGWEPFGTTFLIIMAGLTILVSISDYLLPAMGAKKYGASRLSLWVSMAGMVIGLFLFPPWGMIIGAFLGAVAGELLAGRQGKSALRAGWGVFVGNMLSAGLKLALTGVMLFLYIKEMF
ncbi:MAG: DUF456 domain-containing protein [Desulfobacteraceae bacterium]|nr:DUF456 domain-containing protein [Desulfobacteraceae bacterium]